MTELRKMLNFLKKESGKILIVNESGDPQAVIMRLEEYEKLSTAVDYGGLGRRIKELSEQTDKLNQQIIDAQKDDILLDPDDAAMIEDLTEDKSEQEENFYIEPIEEDKAGLPRF